MIKDGQTQQSPHHWESAYLSISKTGELHGSESGNKVHIILALWHKTQERRSQRLSQRAIRDSLSDPIMMNIATHPSDSRLLTQPCRGCSAFVWRALLQGHGHERKKSNRSSNKSVLPATSPGLKYTQQFIQLPSISCNMICGG